MGRPGRIAGSLWAGPARRRGFAALSRCSITAAGHYVPLQQAEKVEHFETSDCSWSDGLRRCPREYPNIFPPSSFPVLSKRLLDCLVVLHLLRRDRVRTSGKVLCLQCPPRALQFYESCALFVLRSRPVPVFNPTDISSSAVLLTSLFCSIMQTCCMNTMSKLLDQESTR